MTDLSALSDDDLERRIHGAVVERVRRTWDEDTPLLTQWALIGHVYLPPQEGEIAREDYLRLFSDRNLPSHVLLGLLEVVRVQTIGHVLGIEGDDGE